MIDHTRYDHTSVLATAERLFGTHSLTKRDAVANDLLHLISRDKPRDSPSTLPPCAINPSPLHCSDITEILDPLLVQRSELRLAVREGVYKERTIEEFAIPPSQVGSFKSPFGRFFRMPRTRKESGGWNSTGAFKTEFKQLSYD